MIVRFICKGILTIAFLLGWHPEGALAATSPQPTSAPTSQPARGETLTTETIIHAPAEEIFECFTTGPGFCKAMGVADAKVDFRVGGQIRSAYRPGTDLDSDQAIVNTILAYEPNRMLALKATAPAGAPEWLVKICQTGWSVITLEPLTPAITRVRVVGMGYQPGEAFDTAYQFFMQGNTATLQHMKKRLDDPRAIERGRQVLALLKQCAGKTFEMKQELPGGRQLHGTTRWRPDVHEDGLIVEGALGDETSVTPHATLLCGWDHEVGAPYFVQTMESGATARGHLALHDANTVGAVWRFFGPDGDQAWYITFDFSVPDEFTARRWKGDAPTGEPVMSLKYKARTPE
ncbi:MAG TPA: SRPBCC domain-containing protein [Tepidisphaeraceae bacterium]|nr:SRPBCC domain-containing protein [Tepidisphaeraceae bacterium]